MTYVPDHGRGPLRSATDTVLPAQLCESWSQSREWERQVAMALSPFLLTRAPRAPASLASPLCKESPGSGVKGPRKPVETPGMSSPSLSILQGQASCLEPTGP